ncbi:MAG: TrkA family potassium uptake protein [Treponema sp.]|jgi:trk system potassium uptake protein TrkA|nr:TrkA family potassium uptake protein [Treponema sp.]
MKHVAILGLGQFSKSVLTELLELKVEVFIIDKDRQAIDVYKDISAHAAVVDILTIDNLRRILPESTDAVIIDMGNSIEASILATSYCAKLHVKTIIAKAETSAHAEILELVGATKVVFPDKEAAKRITPILLSSVLLNYLPVSGNLVIAELPVPDVLIGKTLISAELRRRYQLNLLSIRETEGEFAACEPGYVFKRGDIGLFAGSDEDLNRFTTAPEKESWRKTLPEQFLQFFNRKQKK